MKKHSEQLQDAAEKSDFPAVFREGANWALSSDVVKGLVSAAKYAGHSFVMGNREDIVLSVKELSDALAAYEEAVKGLNP